MNTVNLDDVELLIFGDYNILTNAPFRDHAPLALLPGRKEYLAYLREDRRLRGMAELQYAVTGNKGGVALGLQSEEEAEAEVRWTAEQIGANGFAVCFAFPDPYPGLERYKAPELLALRKPAPGMIEQLIRELGVPKERVLVVGTYSDDCRAAKSAGVAWQVHGEFFREAERFASKAPRVDQEESDLPADDEGDPFLPDLEVEEEDDHDHV